MLPDETLGLNGTTCPDCGRWLEPILCNSNRGWYIGYFCRCGPVTRETGYYSTKAAARVDLARVWLGFEPENVRK